MRDLDELERLAQDNTMVSLPGPELRALVHRLAVAEAKIAVCGGEWCAQNRAEGRNPCGACALCYQEVAQERDALARKEIRRADCCQRNELERNEAVAVLLNAARELGLAENCRHTPAQMGEYIKAQWHLAVKREEATFDDLELARRDVDRTRRANVTLIEHHEAERKQLLVDMYKLRCALDEAKREGT